MKSLAIISSQAFSLVNFRGQLIADLVAKGVKVFALAPDYTDDLRLNIRALGAVPVDFHLIRTGMSPWRVHLVVAHHVPPLDGGLRLANPGDEPRPGRS